MTTGQRVKWVPRVRSGSAEVYGVVVEWVYHSGRAAAIVLGEDRFFHELWIDDLEYVPADGIRIEDLPR